MGTVRRTGAAPSSSRDGNGACSAPRPSIKRDRDSTQVVTGEPQQRGFLVLSSSRAGSSRRCHNSRRSRREASSLLSFAWGTYASVNLSAISRCTRPAISSRIRRTVSMSLPGGVLEVPVLVALAGEDRAGVAAAHRDDHVGGAHLVGQRLREFPLMSMPISPMASTTAGLIRWRGCSPLIGPGCAQPAELQEGRPPSGCDPRCGRRRRAPRAFFFLFIRQVINTESCRCH